MASTLVTAKTVIVAGGTSFVRERFLAALSQSGHVAVPAATEAELIERLTPGAEGVDLLLLDLRLPPGRRLELVRAVRAIDDGRLPILVFSGTIESADEVRALAALGEIGRAHV